MENIRSLLVNLAQVMMVVVIVVGTLAGFIGGGNANPYAGFSFGMALVGGIVGFVVSAISMSFLAIMLDIRAALLRIQAKSAL